MGDKLRKCSMGVILVLLVAACGGATQGSTPAAEATPTDASNGTVGEAPDVMTVGTDAAYPPHVFLEDDGESVTGVSADVVEMIADEAGVAVEWVITDFTGILTGIDAGRLDAGVIFVDTEERRQIVDILDVMYTGHQFVVPADYQGGEIPPCGATVALAAGSNEIEVLRGISETECEANGKPSYKFDEYPTNDDAALALGSGRADAFLTGAANAGYRVLQAPEDFQVVGPVFEQVLTGIALPKDNREATEELAEAFERAIESGEYANTLERWELGAIAVDTAYINLEEW